MSDKYIPEVGETVLINGGLIGDITSIDLDTDRVSYVTVPAGGGTNTYTEHVSQTRFDPFPPLPIQPELPFADDDE